MEKVYLIACALVTVNCGYITNNQAYSPNSYVQSEVKGGTEIYGGTFVPAASYISSGSFAAQISHSNGYSSGQGSKGGGHVPIIKDGVPVDTPEVQRARAEHFALYAKAAAAAAKASAADAKYEGHQKYQPKYTQTYYTSPSENYNTENDVAYYQPNEHPSSGPGSSHTYIQSESGIHPAKAVYFNTFAGATSSGSTEAHYRQRRGLEYSQFPHDLYGSQPQHIPIITKEGVPVETPEVQAAKLQHLLAHAKAKSGHSEQGLETYGNDHTGYVSYDKPQANKIQYSVVHENTYDSKPYHGPQHIPVIDKNGVPLETPEVQIAKQEHLLAHAKAKLQSQGSHEDWQQNSIDVYGYAHQYPGSLGSSVSHPEIQITSDGVPEDTLEVKIAKVKHQLAHAEEQAKHAQWEGQSEVTYDGGSYFHH